MKIWLLLILTAVLASDVHAESVCSDAWYRTIDNKVPSGDGQGHGPDIGSDEWKSVIEFKLGVRGKPGVPRRDSDAWCQYVDRLANDHASAPGSDSQPAAGQALGPSFACDKVAPGSIEAMICGDTELAALDRKLSIVYQAASSKASNERPPRLKGEQRGWIKGRNECWKSDDKHGCVRNEYRHRIAELQARYRLVPGNGPIRYECDRNPANEVVATFYQTEPPTLIAERGDSVSIMYLQTSGSGAKYQGRNETLWEHHGEALIRWGHEATEMRCKRKVRRTVCTLKGWSLRVPIPVCSIAAELRERFSAQQAVEPGST